MSFYTSTDVERQHEQREYHCKLIAALVQPRTNEVLAPQEGSLMETD